MSNWLENKVKQGYETDSQAPVGTPENPSSKIFTIANSITLLRMALTGVFLWMFIDGTNRYIAVAIYALAACTDWMDGQVARRTQTVSWFGKLLDPICDRFLLFCGVLGLVVRGELPVWVAVLVICRDVYLAIGMFIVRRYRKRPVDVIYVGKIATALLMFGFCDMLLGLPVLGGFNWTQIVWLPLLNSTSAALGMLFIYLGCCFSILAAIIYTVEGAAIIHEAKQRQAEVDAEAQAASNAEVDEFVAEHSISAATPVAAADDASMTAASAPATTASASSGAPQSADAIDQTAQNLD